jgi:hypothetical protein
VRWANGSCVVLFLCSVTGELRCQSTEEPAVLAQIQGALQARRPQPWARLLILADAEAAKLERRKRNDCCDIRTVKIGVGLGYLHYRWNEIQQSENYEHDLLRLVIRQMRGTPEGADALSVLLGMGPYGGPWFDDDELLPDDFAELELHRRIIAVLTSPSWSKLKDYRLMRILGEAYETWWCLSLAKNDDPELGQAGVYASRYVSGAELARMKAVNLYEAVLTTHTDPELRKRLATLRARQDTHHRLWFRAGD